MATGGPSTLSIMVASASGSCAGFAGAVGIRSALTDLEWKE